MDLESSPHSSKILPVLLAILIIALIGACATWYYLRNQPEPKAVQAPTATTAPLDPKTEAKFEISGVLNDIDSDLKEIEDDETSEDDTIDL